MTTLIKTNNNDDPAYPVKTQAPGAKHLDEWAKRP